MYWKADTASSSHLDTLLNKKDVTLQEVLDDEEVLQECKNQNKLLIDFLTRSDILEELVTLTTVEPCEDCDEIIKYKYANIACELLTCEGPRLTDKIAGDEQLLAKLYSFLETDKPLNPLLASFFSKIFIVLIARKCEQNWFSYQYTCLHVLEFLQSKEDFISLLLKHLGTSAIMDLMFKFMTKVEDEMKSNMLTLLDSQNIIQNIVALLNPLVDSDRHTNSAQLLCDVIVITRDTEQPVSDPILDRLESVEIITQLLDHILAEPKSETGIVGGISVLLTLLDCHKKDTCEFNCPASPGSTAPRQVVLNTVTAILPRLQDFHNVLLNPPLKAAVQTTIGLLDPPLGITRVEVARLLSVLVAADSKEINTELARLDTINVLLDLFFKYSWNNFLHTQVEQCLEFALMADVNTGATGEIQDDSLIAHIFVKCRLLERILEAWEENNNRELQLKCPRRGYMGHLIKISNSIAQVCEKGVLGAFFKKSLSVDIVDSWDEFVSTKLKDINTTQNLCLGGVPVEEESPDFKDASYIDTALQQYFTTFQRHHQLAPSFSDRLGSYNEDEFNDSDDIHNTTVDVDCNSRNFNMMEEDNDQQGTAFQQVCLQKLQTLDDEENDMWDSNGAKSLDSQGRQWDGDAGGDNSSSDEEEAETEERTGPDGREETAGSLDSSDLWIPILESNVAPVVDSNPWAMSMFDNLTTSSANPTDNQMFVADFDFEFADINTTIATSSASDVAPQLQQLQQPLDLTPNDTSDMNVCEVLTDLQTGVITGKILSCIAENYDVKLLENAVRELSIDELATAGSAQLTNNNNNSADGDVDNNRLNTSQGLTTTTTNNTEEEPQRGESVEEGSVVNCQDSHVLSGDGEGDGSNVEQSTDNNCLPKVPATLVPTETILNNTVDDNEAVVVTTSNGPV